MCISEWIIARTHGQTIQFLAYIVYNLLHRRTGKAQIGQHVQEVGTDKKFMHLA